MILVDSSVWIDYFNGASTWQADMLDDALGCEVIGVGDLILAEVLQGFRSEKDYVNAKRALLSFQQVALGGTENAIAASVHFRFLREKGVTVRKTIDVFIATACIEHGWRLLHNDRDFAPFEKWRGLRCVQQPSVG